ncbi:MAG: YegS/Rv2252/BmrU family lipid kinase [Firmicutes bacterium]|nr:YegS/Rv2252/BmrU family lipid kinase [Bacillota bacterium]
MKKALVILNPQAGTKQANKYFVEILQVFNQAGYETTVAVTQKQGDGTEIVMDRGNGYELIVAIGGDGTFNEVMDGVLRSRLDVKIGYIPAGSTNDFGSSLGLTKDVVASAHSIVDGSIHHLDVGSFNGRYFSYVASFGAFTQTSYNAPQNLKNTLGHLAYVLEGIKDIPSIKPLKLTVHSEHETYEGEYLFGAICNSTSVAGILTLSEKVVDMTDGKFEVLLIKKPNNVIELNQMVAALATQNLTNSPMITFFSAASVEITAEPDMPWTLDGEYQEGCENIRIQNHHGAIKVCLNEETRVKTLTRDEKFDEMLYRLIEGYRA